MSAFSSAASVSELRRSIFFNRTPQRDDLTTALAWRGVADENYGQLLADIAVELLVNQANPPQYVSEEGAGWLSAQIKASQIDYGDEMRLLTQTIRYAVSLPPALSAFCLAEIEAALVRGCQGHRAGLVDEQDVEYLRQTLYGADAGASLHVTRAEAETLFRIAHACSGGDVDPGFDRLFAGAVGNHLMGLAYRWTPSVEQERRLRDSLEAPPTGLSGFFQSMFEQPATPGSQDLESLDDQDDDRLRGERTADARDRAETEALDPDEVAWLRSQLGRDGALTRAEASLLEFLKQEAVNPPPALRDLCARAGV